MIRKIRPKYRNLGCPDAGARDVQGKGRGGS